MDLDLGKQFHQACVSVYNATLQNKRKREKKTEKLRLYFRIIHVN